VRRLLVAALVALARTLDRAVTVTSFLAAGLLRLDTLGRHMGENWRQFGAAQSEADIAGGLFPWEQRFYGRFLAPGDRVLVVGCGGGRDLIALLELGCRAEGLEPVAVCAEQARERLAARGLAADVVTADIVTAVLRRRYDAVVFSWLCYSYIPLRARRIAVLRKVTAHLEPGGRILISYVPAPQPLRRLPWRLAWLASQLSRADWRPEHGDVFSARPDTGCIHYEHQFTEDEIEAEAHAAGLVVALHEPGPDGNLALRPPA
jgi:SAM-dependent methyltransferase